MKGAHVPEIRTIKALAELLGETPGERGDDLLPIVRTCCAPQFFLGNDATNLPISGHHLHIDSLPGARARLRHDGADAGVDGVPLRL